MHELSIANSILEAAQTEAQMRGAMHLTKISVRIGELAGVDPDALSFSFHALVKDTDLEDCALEIDFVPIRHECQSCGERFVVRNFETRCPKCGAERTTFVSGDELEFAHLEMEKL
jgi:hydrogenase nickel incorporation protein HypA/HybF